jgi:hypothetical protein
MKFSAAFSQFKTKTRTKSFVEKYSFYKRLGGGDELVFVFSSFAQQKIKSCASDTWAGRLDDVRGEAFCG